MAFGEDGVNRVGVADGVLAFTMRYNNDMSIFRKSFWIVTGYLLFAGQAYAACTQTVTNTAQSVTNTSPTILPNPIRAASFQDLANDVLGIVSSIGGVVAVFFIIYAGFLFVTAGGNEDKHKKAKAAILYAVIGTAILLGAQALSSIVCATVESLK